MLKSLREWRWAHRLPVGLHDATSGHRLEGAAAAEQQQLHRPVRAAREKVEEILAKSDIRFQDEMAAPRVVSNQ